jgi:hypothetical protein
MFDTFAFWSGAGKRKDPSGFNKKPYDAPDHGRYRR